MDFRIRQLQCFLTLSELLNYGKTARALYMSQPTITFQIKSLEESFGVRLFDRDRQQVRLTDAGFAFREYAQTIIDTVGAARERLSDLHTRLRLRISCGPIAQYILLPNVLRILAQRYPGFELDICDLTTEQQITALTDGKLDGLLMVGALPIPDARFDLICRESLVAIVSRQNPLAAAKSISVEDLRTNKVIAARLDDCRLQQPFVHALLAPYGITPTIVEAPQSPSMQFAYAAADEGVVITTESMAICMFPGVVTLPFLETLSSVQLGLISIESKTSRALTIFREVVMESARNSTFPSALAECAPHVLSPGNEIFPGGLEAR